tara:strand:- start:2256 stop:2822 length:567 start_codon:yes stop_codon:yes gene_type:complete
MPKPNVNFSLTEIKEYIKMKGLDKPEIKLSMSRAQLVEGLKKHGHWDDSVEKTKKTRVSKKPKAPPKEKKPRGRPKGSKNKKGTKPKKLSKGQEDFLGGIDDSPKKKAAPKKKPNRKTYYVGFDRLDPEEEDMYEQDGWKFSSSYGDFSVLKRTMSSLSEDSSEAYDNAPYRSIGTKLVYGNRQQFKK